MSLACQDLQNLVSGPAEPGHALCLYPQVPQHALRQRARLRPRARAPAQRHGRHCFVSAHAHHPRDGASYTPELSRRARGVEVWAALRSLGRSGVAELVERTCRLATQFADGLRAAGFEVLNDVVLNQVLVSFGDAATAERAIAAIQRDGTCWAGVTRWQGQTAMRISVSCWRTTEADVERSLEAMVRAARGATHT